MERVRSKSMLDNLRDTLIDKSIYVPPLARSFHHASLAQYPIVVPIISSIQCIQTVGRLTQAYQSPLCALQQADHGTTRPCRATLLHLLLVARKSWRHNRRFQILAWTSSRTRSCTLPERSGAGRPGQHRLQGKQRSSSKAKALRAIEGNGIS